ncbi:ABC transporter ATP-binding protein [Phytomonospora sp. NPDC050363]|uniref:ABC transporter ATP-binding protein n=1 Tax=Phytomonospora sp. NPDC050363 TaxID=3155642 RepID=UPI0033ED45E5
MIRRLIALTDDRAKTARYGVLLCLSAFVRAGAVLALIPLLSKLFSDSPSGAVPWTVLLTALVALGWFVDHRLYRVGFDIGFTILRVVESRVLDRLEHVPLGWLDARRRGDAQRALTSAGQELCQGVGYLVTPTVNAMLTPLLVGVGLLAVAWPLGVAAIASVPLLFAAMAVGGRLLRGSDEAYAQASDDVGARIVELAQHQAALRAAGRAGAHGSALGGALARQRRAALRLLAFGVPGNLVFGVVTQLALLALAATSVSLYLADTVTAPALVALIIVSVRFLEPFTTLGDLSPAIQNLKGTLARVGAILDAPGLPVAEDPAAPEPGPVLEFDRVDFSYAAGDGFALTGVSFSVPAGTTTAVVGPSGSGKSTVLALAARLHDTTGGAIRIGGRDIRAYSPADLAEVYAVVHQNVYLFDGTLHANVLLGRRRADRDDLAEAASKAGLDETLERLPLGWDTRVGESGATLSGGERQRVAIARALLKDAPLLLLDEATSALDTGNERGIVAALGDSSPTRATVIVAHRLDTIIGADQVVFIDGGRVREIGSPRELIAAGGRFAEYWRQRHDAAGWQLLAGTAGSV